MRIKNVRAVEKKLSKPIGILADMQGPKYRIGIVEEGLSLIEGNLVQFDLDDKIGNSEKITASAP